MTTNTISRYAFAYDFLVLQGGAERLALQVERANKDLDLIAAYIDRNVFSEDSVPASVCRTLIGSTDIRGWHGLKTMFAFDHRSAFLKQYETVVFSGFYSVVGAAQRAGMNNLYYCHTPPRFVYDLKDFFHSESSPLQKVLLSVFVPHIRKRYEKSLKLMDGIAVNSVNVQNRLSRYLGIDNTTVIYPPVNTTSFNWVSQGDFYLSTARVEPYKRVDRIVRAFMNLPDKKLVVASGGTALESLRQMAIDHDNIVFTNWQTEEQLRDLMGRCLASIYIPHDEDFGISPVESMAAGKPVIGVAQGGLLETVIDGQTGKLIDPAIIDQPGTLEDGINWLTSPRAAEMRQACEIQAAKFDDLVFDRRFREFLES